MSHLLIADRFSHIASVMVKGKEDNVINMLTLENSRYLV